MTQFCRTIGQKQTKLQNLQLMNKNGSKIRLFVVVYQICNMQPKAEVFISIHKQLWYIGSLVQNVPENLLTKNVIQTLL